MADDQQPSPEMRQYEKQVSTAPSVVPQPPQAPVPPAKPITQGEPKPGWGQKLHAKWHQLKDFYRECVRVLKVTKKPDRQEYTTVVKISGLGILAIGLIGFLIHLVKELLL